jgi:cell division protein FtsI/penicillin-binding protein 2
MKDMKSPLQKSNRLLQIFLSAFLLIAFRVWYLAVMQRDELVKEAQKPQRRVIVEPAMRGRIVDRFGIPLAANRVSYHVAVYYSQFSSIPATAWKIDENGQKVRQYPRKEYVRNLSKLLGQELGMDAERIEDLVHAKASLFPHIPFILRSHIDETCYYRMKALEREWPGLNVSAVPERIYPLGKTAAPIIGYLGAITQKEYLTIATEMAELHKTIAKESINGNIPVSLRSLMERYQELKEKAYTINDLVGKAGIEKQYEQNLRGFYGKKILEVDHRGNYIQEIPGGHDPKAGQTLVLSLSAELQQFCESLLVRNEKTREQRSIGYDGQTQSRKILKQPYIKGGAIVAIDPKTGEILAIASTPRFDPNDYIFTFEREQKIGRVRRWQESANHIGYLWDGKDYLRHEEDPPLPLTWERWLEWILSPDSPLAMFWKNHDDLRIAIQMQEDFEALLYYAAHPSAAILIDLLFPDAISCAKYPDPPIVDTAFSLLQQHASDAMPHWRRLESLLKEIPHNADKLFALDISRTVAYSPAFTDELIRQTGSIKLSDYRKAAQTLQRLEEIVRNRCRILFHQNEFKNWRHLHQKEFLKQKRQEEKSRSTYARPYIDYLDRQEQEMFCHLWQEIRFPLLASLLRPMTMPPTEKISPYLDIAMSVNEATATIGNEIILLNKASGAVSDGQLVQWLKTMRSYRELNRPLLGEYRFVHGAKGKQTEKNLAAAFYPSTGFGFSRSHAWQGAAPVGSLFKLVTAAEGLRQYEPSAFPLILFDQILFDDKSNMIVASSIDHQPYYRHYKGGRLPRSHAPDMGKIDLVGALEQSSNPYFAILAGDFLKDPYDLVRAAANFGFGSSTGIDLPGEFSGHLPDDLASNRTGLYSFAIGQHTLLATPLQAAVMLSAIANGGQMVSPKIVSSQEVASRPCPISPSTRQVLCEGMDRAVWGSKGSAHPSSIRALKNNPSLMREFLSLQHQMIGKTGTAEIACRLDANPSAEPHIYKHIWFGAIAFSPADAIKSGPARWDNPELVVVVYLRYGDGGKEAAPLAASVIRKWREICSNHTSNSIRHIDKLSPCKTESK